MSDRLDLIRSLIEPADAIADVGCDHALIAKHCVDGGLSRRVIASDISEKCLRKAKALLRYADNVEFVCCDGLKYECDEAVIAGMGGLTICSILRDAIALPRTVIVSPHRDEDTVRSTLLQLGYGIDKDVQIEERGKYYSVIRGKLGVGARELDELQLCFGLECRSRNAALKKRLLSLYSAYMHAPLKNAQKLRLITEAMRFQD